MEKHNYIIKHKTPVFGREKKNTTFYKGIKIMSDTSLHEQVTDYILCNLVEKGNDRNKVVIIDLGCGAGALSQRLFDLGFQVYSVDIDEKQFKANGPTFIELDLDSEGEINKFIENNKIKFNIILCIEVIEHLKSPWMFISFLNKISNSGAEVLITTPNISSWWARLMFLLYGELWGFDSESWDNPKHINPIGAVELRKILEENSFLVLNVFSCGILPIIWFYNIKRFLLSISMLPLYFFMKGYKEGWVLCFHTKKQK